MAPMETKAEAQSKGKSVKDETDEEKEEEEVQERFSPEEEASLLAESNATKTDANALFASAKYDAAIAKYDEAAASCPNYLDYELAVLRSNISACHLKLEQWKDAISSATAALDGLDKLDKQAALDEKESQQRREKEKALAEEREKARAAAKKEEEEEEEGDDEEGVEAEIITPGARKAAPAPAPALAPAASNDEDESAAAAEKEEQARRRSSSSSRRRADDVLRIRAKALMRRARARSEEGGWQNLAGAEEDYRALAGMKNLAPADRRIVDAQLRTLPPRTKAAQEKETAEMWGKLKDLGNGILKPFGLSTDNFQMVKDENTGGYSMNFTQGQGK